MSFSLSRASFLLWLRQRPGEAGRALHWGREMATPAASGSRSDGLRFPGGYALAAHRLAHWLYRAGLPVLPRVIAHLIRFGTGIDIHPGARLGRDAILAGGCIVIGETAIVGDRTRIFQGVTLGGTGKETGKRHPTVGCDVILEPGATVLGNIRIGDRAVVSANAIVLKAVPDCCTAVGVPSRNVCECQTAIAPLDPVGLSERDLRLLHALGDRLDSLETRVARLASLSFSPSETDSHERAKP